MLLAQHPEVEVKLAIDIDRGLGKRPWTVDDLPALAYTDAVRTETMRLYPPAWAVGREALEDDSLGGYDIPKGTQLWASQWVVHRDARFFEHPTRLSPERWTGGLAKRLPKFAYFPFGGGPRLCIGSAFALMEAKLLLATIAQRRRLRLLPGHERVESVAGHAPPQERRLGRDPRAPRTTSSRLLSFGRLVTSTADEPQRGSDSPIPGASMSAKRSGRRIPRSRIQVSARSTRWAPSRPPTI